MMGVRIIIQGRVQGVFFRKSTKIEADKLGLVGWVRNDPDGSVEVMASGDKGKLELLVAWCRKGPPFSEVKNVELDWIKNGEEFKEFSVL